MFRAPQWPMHSRGSLGEGEGLGEGAGEGDGEGIGQANDSAVEAFPAVPAPVSRS